MKVGSWFLFTARDPAASLGVLEACHKFGNERRYPIDPDVILWRDEHREGLGVLMDRSFNAFPDLDFYGWLADDTYPETKHWNRKLENAAYPLQLSYAEDGGYLSPGGGPKDGTELSSGLCWGGDLVRATGSWSLGFHSAWIDMAWLDLLRPLGLLRYVPEVTVRHDNWRTGRRERDDLDDRALERVHHDQQDFFRWQEEEAPRLRQQIEGALACVS